MGTSLDTIIIVSSKRWHDSLFEHLSKRISANWIRITEKKDFTADNLKKLEPTWVFIPHWSHIIPAAVFENFKCVVFHMTDLPFGRGGSPLQNLIVRGLQETMISAIKVNEGLDTGDVYLKKPLRLCGTAEEIFIRSTEVIEEMIVEIMTKDPQPIPQSGAVVSFKRRTPEESDLACLDNLQKVYDYIRMLDCEGYPKAFIEVNGLKFEFSRASFKSDGSITADVRISKK